MVGMPEGTPYRQEAMRGIVEHVVKRRAQGKVIFIIPTSNERQRTCREILGTQDRSNGYIDYSVRLGTLKDGYTDAQLVATRSKPPASLLSALARFSGSSRA